MRISGYGSGSGGHGGRKDRRKAFRSTHSVGQRVVGAFKGWQDETLAWVEIDGQALLAQLDADPHPGQRFLFVIKQLEPDIMLQVLRPGGAGAMALAQLAQEFWSLRIRFELGMRSLIPRLLEEPRPEAREKLFFVLLREAPEAAEAWAALERSMQEINSWLQTGGKGRLLLAPWLLPQARDFEILETEGKDSGVKLRELVAAFDLPDVGHCELRMLLRPPKARYRLLAERPDLAAPLQHALGEVASACAGWYGHAAGLELEPGGLGHLAPGPRTVLAPYLHDESQRFLPRFSTHV